MHTRILVKMKDRGEFTLELYPEYAPATVENFVSLVRDGFYDGLTFHRVYPGFMAQGGDPDGNGQGGSRNKIKGEFAANGFSQNTIEFKRGVIAMARATSYDSASSQFFICYTDDCDYLYGSYAAFGRVVDGMDVVDSFCDVELGMSDTMDERTKPLTPIVIESMTVVE